VLTNCNFIPDESWQLLEREDRHPRAAETPATLSRWRGETVDVVSAGRRARVFTHISRDLGLPGGARHRGPGWLMMAGDRDSRVVVDVVTS
jgi:hypothetical protein